MNMLHESDKFKKLKQILNGATDAKASSRVRVPVRVNMKMLTVKKNKNFEEFCL